MTNTTARKPKAPTKKEPETKPRKRLALKAAITIAALHVLGFFLIGSFFNAELLPEGAQPTRVLVPERAPVSAVSKALIDKNLNAPDTLISLAVRAAFFRRPVHAGWYDIRPGDRLSTVMQRLRNGEVAKASMRIPEGFPLWKIRDILAGRTDVKQEFATLSDAEAIAKIVASSPDLAPASLRANGEAVESLEGLLSPDTYFFAVGQSDLTLIARAMRQQRKVLNAEWQARDPDVNETLRSPYEALILASIVEKESGLKVDRKLVASVFHNRLRIGMPLQTDPTVIYGIGRRFDGNLTKAHLRTNTPYNTYTNQGLPPTPIAAPSRESIHATLHPEKTRYLYFVARGDGTTEFSENLSAHNRAVDRYQRQ